MTYNLPKSSQHREFSVVIRNGKVISCALATQAIALQADIDNELIFAREVSQEYDKAVEGMHKALLSAATKIKSGKPVDFVEICEAGVAFEKAKGVK